MEDRIKLSYFYGREADQYSFYRIPKLLFTEEYFKKISVEAKVLYGLMLDRMSLSMKNQWFDTEGRAYIYYCLLYTSPSPRDRTRSRMPSSA